MKSFEIRIQDSPRTILNYRKRRRWLSTLDTLNKVTTVWAIQVFFFFAAAFTDIVGVQAREKFARKLLVKISATKSIELGFKFTFGISPLTNFAKFSGTVLLSYVIIFFLII